MITATGSSNLPVAGLDAGAPDASGGARTRQQGGSVVFVNDHWDIDIAANGSISITSLATGQVFMAWADPPENGPAFEFTGYTTLLLADGTKVTLHTSHVDMLSAGAQPDSVLIVSGDYGVQVLGLQTGLLSYVETQDYGWLMDALVPDGATVMHSPDGPGLVGDNPQGLWQVLDVPELDGATGSFGPLAGPTAHTLLSAEGVTGMLFMGSFSRMPTVKPFEFDHSPSVRPDPYRLLEQQDLMQRLVLMRVDGRVKGWMSSHPGVHPSSGAPGCRRPADAG